MARIELNDALFELIAERFKVLAVAARLKILDALRGGEKTPSRLIEETGLAQANLSKHLQLLHLGRFVERRHEGTFTYYRLNGDDVARLCDLMCGRLQAELGERIELLGGHPDEKGS